MLIKNGTVHVRNKKNYLHKKFKDFQFSMLENERSQKKKFTVQNVLMKMSGSD